MPRGISLWIWRWSAGARIPAVGQDVEVGGEDEVVFEPRAEFGVAAGGVDAEVLGGGGVDGEVERHGEAEGVEAGAEVGGGRGQAEVERLALDEAWSCGLEACVFMWDSSARRTSVGVGFEDDGRLAQGGVAGLIGRGELRPSRRR